jgi:DNA-binding CsgD family transcriptional regulator
VRTAQQFITAYRYAVCCIYASKHSGWRAHDPAGIMDFFIGESSFMPTAMSGPPTLTARERECLSWIAQGKTGWETGAILRISERTVVFHLHNARRKLGVHNRSAAVARAVRLGLLDGTAQQDPGDRQPGPIVTDPVSRTG